MGVLAPVSAHAGPFAQPPIGTSGIFPPRVSAESPSNIPDQGGYIPDHFGCCAPKIGFFRGVGGGAQKKFSPLESYYFCELGAHAKI